MPRRRQAGKANGSVWKSEWTTAGESSCKIASMRPTAGECAHTDGTNHIDAPRYGAVRTSIPEARIESGNGPVFGQTRIGE